MYAPFLPFGYLKSGPPLEARQPRLGPWLDFEKKKMVVAAAA